MVRAFVLGVAVGAAGLLLGIIEFVRRAAGVDARPSGQWPRHDGSDQGFGTVWDHGA
jgi:hypothetical protein